MIGGRKFEISRELDDEKGPYLREFRIEMLKGHIEYEYMRKGKHGERMESSSSNVSATFYDENGIPEGGEIVARYENGEWQLTS